MSGPGLQAQIDAAKAYEELFVPALFAQWAPKVADEAGIQPGQRVLDVACGTGILARTAASRLKSKGQVTGIDPNPGMIAQARQLAPAIEWREGVAEALPFPDETFDAVVSQFGLMFFADRHQALGEMVRVLKTGGRLVVAVWNSLENIPAYSAEVRLLEETAGKPAADALRAPFGLGDEKDLARIFADAGLASAIITTRTGTARFPSIRVMVEADLRGWLPVMGVILTEDQINRILHDAEQALHPWATADGHAAFPVSAHIVGATKK